MNHKQVRVPLQGGLGNQLFQLTGSMYYSGESLGYLELYTSDSVNLKKFSIGLDEFELPESVVIDYLYGKFTFQRKLRNLSTRLGSRSRKKTWRPVSFLLEFFYEISRYRNYPQTEKVLISNGPGYDIDLKARIESSGKSNFHIIGYFQTYMTNSEDIMSRIQGMKLKKNSKWLVNRQNEAKLSAPIIVHMRFGDYSSDKILQSQEEIYYSRALEILIDKIGDKPTWIFTDDTSRAQASINLPEFLDVSWFSNEDASAAESLVAMKLGCAYIISSSTFGWWAARLSASKDAIVIAPAKWFKDGTEPSNLCPDKWIRL